jgi:hypothetical protein
MKFDVRSTRNLTIQRDLSTLYIDESYYKYDITNRYHRMLANFLHVRQTGRLRVHICLYLSIDINHGMVRCEAVFTFTNCMLTKLQCTTTLRSFLYCTKETFPGTSPDRSASFYRAWFSEVLAGAVLGIELSGWDEMVCSRC